MLPVTPFLIFLQKWSWATSATSIEVPVMKLKNSQKLGHPNMYKCIIGNATRMYN